MRSHSIQAAERLVVETLARTGRPDSLRRRRMSRVIAAVVALALGVWIGSLLWPQWLAYQSRQPPKPDVPSLTAAPAMPPSVMSPDAKISVLGTDSSVSEKPLQLVLVSTTVGSTPSESTAALGTDPHNPQTYAVGSVLVNGAVIKEIQPDRIVLEENGRRTSVAVDHGVSARLAVKDSLLHSEHVSPTVLASLSEAPGHKSALTVGGKASDSESVGRPRGLGGDFSQILRSQLVFERDKVAGFQIFAGSRRSALSQLGLKEGDIVRTIDGRPIEGADAWLTIGNAVSSGSSIVVGIERDGSLLPVMLDGAVLDGSPEFEVSPRG